MKKMKPFTKEWWHYNLIAVGLMVAIIAGWELLRLLAWGLYFATR